MKLWLTKVPPAKLDAIKLLRAQLQIPLKEAVELYNMVAGGEAAEIKAIDAPKRDNLSQGGLATEWAPEAPELSQPAAEAPQEPEISAEAYRAMAVLLGTTGEGSVVKVVMAAKLMSKTHDKPFWDEVFRACTDTFNVDFQS